MPLLPPLFCPAKINLTLAVTGRRADGFHDLVSLVAPVSIGDTLHVEAAPAWELRLTCSDSTLPVTDDNLVLKAARAFVAATGWRGGVQFHLEKRLPVGAGLGGGSSDAAATLRALNRLAAAARGVADATTATAGWLPAAELAAIAATVGSDVSLFLADGPVVMRGRGERVEPLAPAAVARLRGRSVALFKPDFGVSTPWAYRVLAAGAPATYCDPARAEALVAGWLTGPDARVEARDGNDGILFNSFSAPVGAHHVALPVLLEALAAEFGVPVMMSGSGSACFALAAPEYAPALPERVRAAWGEAAFFAWGRIL